MDNLRATMSWAYAHRRPRLGLSIARNSRFHFFTLLADRELVRWLRTGLELVDDDDPLTLEAAAAMLLHAHNADDPDAQRFAAARVERAIDDVDDPRLTAELLNAMSASVVATDPRAADSYTNAAAALRASPPNRMLAFLNNRIEQSWDTGELADGEAILLRLEQLLDMMPHPNPVTYKVEAGVAARAGRWTDVVDIAETADDLDPVMGAAVGLLHAEALGVLGRFDEALLTLTSLDRDGLSYHATFVDLVHTSTDLRRHEPRAAADRLGAMVDDDRLRRPPAGGRCPGRSAARGSRPTPSAGTDGGGPVRTRRRRSDGSPSRCDLPTADSPRRRSKLPYRTRPRSASTSSSPRGTHRVARPAEGRPGRSVTSQKPDPSERIGSVNVSSGASARSVRIAPQLSSPRDRRSHHGRTPVLDPINCGNPPKRGSATAPAAPGSG